jgi:hypothetical protein
MLKNENRKQQDGCKLSASNSILSITVYIPKNTLSYFGLLSYWLGFHHHTKHVFIFRYGAGVTYQAIINKRQIKVATIFAIGPKLICLTFEHNCLQATMHQQILVQSLLYWSTVYYYCCSYFGSYIWNVSSSLFSSCSFFSSLPFIGVFSFADHDKTSRNRDCQMFYSQRILASG